ncbi:CinA family protein [Butyrivibrio sp. NC3005]|uniref:CinA family protein n=1 Tax=Butyrivibrio sp. NC3005 TaxID=1280685 RepID=UPI000413483E|nr:CinA family protein [Butyrivibrio sp. NC3005]
MAENELLVKLLISRKMKITTAESCTGGMVAAAITDIEGSSEVFKRGFVTYSNEAKEEMLGVEHEIIEKYTEISFECAESMARNAAVRANADVAIATTGIAGPGGGTKEHPIGCVYIGFFVNGKVFSEKKLFTGDRSEVRRQAVECAIHRVLEIIQ